MTKKERVLAAIHHEAVDHVPSGFSLHFDPALHNTPGEIRAHLDFFEQTDTDIQKIMNENLVPDFGPVTVPEDWQAMGSYSRDADFIQRQATFTKRLLEQASQDAYNLGTLHGIVASAIHPIEHRYGYEAVRALQCQHLRSGKPYQWDAMRRIADALCYLAEEYAKAGVDGIYFASLGGEARYFTDEEFAQYIAPLDMQIMKAAKEAGLDVFLHACKDGLVMERYQSYLPLTDVINWGIQDNPRYTLALGRELFPNVTLMGGLANGPESLLHRGTAQDIRQAVAAVLEQAGTGSFILGADCTLPPDTPYENFRVAAHATRQ